MIKKFYLSLGLYLTLFFLAGCTTDNLSSSSTRLFGLSSCSYTALDSSDAAVILTVDSTYRALLKRYTSVYEPLYKNPPCFKKTLTDSTFTGTFHKVDDGRLSQEVIHCYSMDIDPESILYVYKYSSEAAATLTNEQWTRTRLKEISAASTEEGEYSSLVDYNQVTVGNWIVGGLFLGHVQQNQFIPSGYGKLSREFFASISSNNVLRLRCQSSVR